MRGVSTKLWASVNERTVFVGYRWLAWALAGLLFLVGAAPWQRVEGIWLLSLTALVNLGLTLWSDQYVRLVRQYRVVLLVDLVFVIALLWVSGGWRSPFQVYAYSPLVLPALLWGRVGGLAGALAITIGNLIVLRFAPVASPTEAGDQLNMLINLVAPLSLALLLPPVYRRACARARALSSGSNQNSPRSGSSQRPMRELHDNVLQHLSVVSRQVAPTAERAVVDEPAAAPLGAVHAAAAPSNQELRRSVFGPTPGCDVLLDAALGQIVQGFGRYSSVATRLNIIGQPGLLQPAAYGALVRLAQEALLNVEQHAHAHWALVTLRCEQWRIVLTIQDDGVGLLDGTYQRPGLHSLRAIGYRLAEAGGSLEVCEGESGGLTVRGSVPLAATELDG